MDLIFPHLGDGKDVRVRLIRCFLKSGGGKENNNRNIYNLKEFPNGDIPTPDEKRELIDDYYKLMINFAQQGLKYLELTRKK